ncbi:MAG: hypothetical protein SCALA702_17780 [Melioribacteraceae bacterium]|nr:MAG: hypothetical protein SCALA702_17780 [Melioribacteraceae bacterium]
MKKVILLLSVFSISLFAQQNFSEFKYEFNNRIKLQESYSMPDEVSGKKSAGLAILYSVLLPGMGELYAGDYSTGKYFTIADGVFWGFVAGFNIYGNYEKNNYQSYAEAYGGVNLEQKNDEYWAIIGDYTDVNQFNTIQELNRDFNEVYSVETHYWKWESEVARKDYRNSWSSSEQAYNNVRFAVGALVLNRIVSAINAVRLVARHNNAVEESQGLSFNMMMSREVDYSPKLNLNMRAAF